MKILIIGFGSIGKRHARVLQKTLKISSESIFIRDLISSRKEEALNQGFNIDDGNLSYDIVVLAASTASHIQILKDIPIPKKLLYVEKPLGHKYHELAPVLRRLMKKIKGKRKAVVGYMLRQHPAVFKIREILKSKKMGKILKYRAECGMYLPNWHPWEDYRSFYMSQIDGGGGALLDISHEIDLMLHLSGKVKSVYGKFGNISDLECSSDDYAEFILQHKNGVVGSVSLDLIQKNTFRKTRLILEKGEIELDFINKKLLISTDIDKYTEKTFNLEGDDLYIKQYKDALNSKRTICCSLEEGLEVMEVIEAVRSSSVSESSIFLPLYSG
jgi:predicted dehydrogenase